jgi:hypothetical protein
VVLLALQPRLLRQEALAVVAQVKSVALCTLGLQARQAKATTAAMVQGHSTLEQTQQAVAVAVLERLVAQPCLLLQEQEVSVLSAVSPAFLSTTQAVAVAA